MFVDRRARSGSAGARDLVSGGEILLINLLNSARDFLVCICALTTLM